MTLEEKVLVIRSNFLFESLAESHLAEIAEKTVIKTVPPNTVIIEQDTLDTVVYFIAKGSVRIYRSTIEGDQVPIAQRSAGDIVGEMALFNNFRRLATVESLTEIEVLTISAEQFLKVLYSYPEISISLLQVVTRQLFEVGQEVGSSFSGNLVERAGYALKSLSQLYPDKEITMPYDELALMLGASLDRLREVLKDFQEQGKIALLKEGIKVLQ